MKEPLPILRREDRPGEGGELGGVARAPQLIPQDITISRGLGENSYFIKAYDDLTLAGELNLRGSVADGSLDLSLEADDDLGGAGVGALFRWVFLVSFGFHLLLLHPRFWFSPI